MQCLRFLVGLLGVFCAGPALCVTNEFFSASQTATVIVSNANAVTIQSGDYRFTYSVDGFWSPGGGTPTGRFFSVLWPNGVQAQAITAGPQLGAGANITLKRADGKVFDLQSFTGKILMNTAGAGAAFEIMPLINGNDAFRDPVQFGCSGYAGQSFNHTPALTGYDTYKIHMWGDYAITALSLIDTNAPFTAGPSFAITTSVSPADAGTAGGAGIYPSNSICSLAASANPGWGFQKWTENGIAVSTTANYSFPVRADRTLVANFVPAFTINTAVSPAYAGTTSGDGTFNSNSVVLVTATPNPGFKFVNWTEFGMPASISANYSFKVQADRSLVANFVPDGFSAIFDFDTGAPSLLPGEGMPPTQTKNGVSATFSTISGGWSVQNDFYYWLPGVFSGNFLYPSASRSAMAVEFSEPVTNFTMSFFTGEVSSEYDIGGLVRVTAYTNSATTTPVATGSARGTWVSGAYPEGVLSFGSAVPFTKVIIEMPTQSPAPSYFFFIDNVVVHLAVPPAPHEAPLAFGGAFFQLASQPLAINIADLTWNDYDPDGEPVFFVDASATTSNGLPLIVEGAQILVPTNSLADTFTYRIADIQGVTAQAVATISIITNPTSHVSTVDAGVPGGVNAQFAGVPWYYYTAQRATNANFTGTLQTWPVQAWADGSIYIWDDFSDLTNKPPQAFYRLCYP